MKDWNLSKCSKTGYKKDLNSRIVGVHKLEFNQILSTWISRSTTKIPYKINCSGDLEFLLTCFWYLFLDFFSGCGREGIEVTEKIVFKMDHKVYSKESMVLVNAMESYFKYYVQVKLLLIKLLRIWETFLAFHWNNMKYQKQKRRQAGPLKVSYLAPLSTRKQK